MPTEPVARTAPLHALGREVVNGRTLYTRERRWGVLAAPTFERAGTDGMHPKLRLPVAPSSGSYTSWLHRSRSP